MTEPRSHWFKRTFDSSAKRSLAAADEGQRCLSPPTSAAANDHQLEEVRLVARAEALSACAAVARVYEEKAAGAGVIRIILSNRADEAWTRVDAHHHTPDPLEEADRCDDRSASSSGTAGANGEGDSSAVPLLESRLHLIAKSLDGAIDTVSGPSGRRLLGGAAKSLEDYLRTIQGIAQGKATVPEPQSLRVVDPPALRVVK